MQSFFPGGFRRLRLSLWDLCTLSHALLAFKKFPSPSPRPCQTLLFNSIFSFPASHISFSHSFPFVSPSFLGRFFQNRPTPGARSCFRWLFGMLRWLFEELCSLSTFAMRRIDSRRSFRLLQLWPRIVAAQRQCYFQ